MTLPRLAALSKHWEIFPPTHKALARLSSAFLKEDGGGHRSEEKKKGTLNDLMAVFGKSGGAIK
ncbi:hypothetical protein CCP3SC15_1070012 [Gammaproteobacteria bacterium]